MRIVVMSDSHRQFGPIQRIIEAQPDADMFIHLGDGQQECENIPIFYPDKKFYYLKGNCDFSFDFHDFLVIPIDNQHRIFAAHGHKYGVKSSNTALLEAAYQNGCDIALYGHTHVRYNNYENGIHILNPGSCSCPRDGMKPSYAFIDIVDGKVFKNIVSL